MSRGRCSIRACGDGLQDGYSRRMSSKESPGNRIVLSNKDPPCLLHSSSSLFFSDSTLVNSDRSRKKFYIKTIFFITYYVGHSDCYKL